MIMPGKNQLVWITVLAAVTMVAWQNYVGGLSYFFQILFFAFAIFSFGIPHGALDHLVGREIAKHRKSKFSLTKFLFNYLLSIVLYALLWYWFPQLSLLIFLMLSCWHFAETDVAVVSGKSLITASLKLIYGLAVLAWLLWAHVAEVSAILKHLIPAKSLFFVGWLAGVVHASFILIISAIIILIVLGLPVFTQQKTGYFLSKLPLVIILACGYTLPLMPAFALYFAGWHSLITLYNIKGFIGYETISNKPLSILKLWLKALPFSLLAIGGLLLTGYLLRHYAPLFDPLPLLFVFLSLITLPHMQVMHGLNSKLQIT